MTKTEVLTQWGLEDEAKVIKHLQASFFRLKPSSKNDNILFDRDCWVMVNGITPYKPVSIKSQQACLKTGNLCFQTYVAIKEIDPKLGYYDTDLELFLQWEKSDWFMGRVDFYAILVGSTVYWINKLELIDFLRENNGWDKIRQLHKNTKLNQLSRGHKHLDARVGLISLQKLLTNNIAQNLGVLRPKK